MKRLRETPWFFFAASLVVLASFVLAFVHQHADGQDFDRCSVCKFVRQVISFSILLVTVFFVKARPEFVVPGASHRRFLFLSSKLRTRAPPLLS